MSSSQSLNSAHWAARYIERFDVALTWTPPGAKGPRHHGWNLEANAIKDAPTALEFWRSHPDYGIGVMLSYSGLASLDIDHVEYSRTIFAKFGLDLDELRQQAPCVVGNPDRFRLTYRAPDGMELRHRTASWPKRDNVQQTYAVFELRAGAISDSVPPTIRVRTGQPYRWENPPRNGFPPLPKRLLALWQDWAAFNRETLALCPWAPTPKETTTQRTRTQTGGDSVIDASNSAYEVTTVLEAHGYQRRGKRFASPDTGHAAGIVLLEDGRVYCHHAGDPLSGEHAHDAFDVYRLLQHGGDFRAAVKTAAKVLEHGR